jgi:hypothetical protein
VLLTIAAVALVLLVGAGVAAYLYVDFVREHGPLGSEESPVSDVLAEEHAELARRFSPVLRYHSNELFFPIPQAAYVSKAQLKEQEARFVRLANKAPKIDLLPEREGTCLKSRGCLYFLDIRGFEPDPPADSQRKYATVERQLRREGATPTLYTRVVRYDDTGEYAVQYWFLYLFNFRLNEHESDWEQITVRLDGDRNPIGVLYSAHEGSNTREWAQIERDGEHPVVYPALGAHANYFQAGRHPVSVGCRRVVGSIRQCLRGRRILVDVADGRGRELGPDDYALSELAGPVFIGSYGSGNYVVLTRRPASLSDPRTRSAWRDPLRSFR